MVKNYLFSVIRIVIILITVCNCVFAQSEHTDLWNFSGDFYWEFASETEKNNIPELKNAVCYVDSDGKNALIVKDYQLYNKEMILTKNSESFSMLMQKGSDKNVFFIPIPTNENLVYLFHNNNYILIDVNANQVISAVKKIDVNCSHKIVVYASDCKGMWLIYYDENGLLYKYLITEDGISKYEVVDLNVKGMCSIKLSRDCKHFVINSHQKKYSTRGYLNSTVCYGDFDDGNFIVKNEFVFPITTVIADVIISEDNSKIFYTSHTLTLEYPGLRSIDPEFYEIYKADIISGVPDYENAAKIYSEEFTGGIRFWNNTAYYGMDDNIYILNRGSRKYFVIYYGDYNTIQVEPSNLTEDFKPWFVSSWFSEKPCNGNDVPCSGTSRPKIICE